MTWGDSVHVVKKGQREKAKSTGHKAGGREQKKEQEIVQEMDKFHPTKTRFDELFFTFFPINAVLA